MEDGGLDDPIEPEDPTEVNTIFVSIFIIINYLFQ